MLLNQSVTFLGNCRAKKHYVVDFTTTRFFNLPTYGTASRISAG